MKEATDLQIFADLSADLHLIPHFTSSAWIEADSDAHHKLRFFHLKEGFTATVQI